MISKSVDTVNKQAEDPDADVLEAIHGVMHVVRAQQQRALRDAQSGLTHMESKVLGFFARHPGATLTALVAHSGRDKGQLAKLIGGLRDRGLLEARPSESDRRTMAMHLTPEGRAAHQLLRRQARRLAGVAVQGLDEAQRRQLLGLLARVRANLEAAGEGGAA